MYPEIPLPIMFNPLKHHFHFLLGEIERWKKCTWPEVNEELLSVGSNLIDFYTGKLNVSQICKESLAFFREQEIDSRDKFLMWVQGPNWKKIELSDQSEWLIKMGNQEERYLHIHPAKFSKHTIRIRATTLKTVLALLVHETPVNASQKINLEPVNSIRKNRLALSPIKSLHSADSGIMRLWLLFEKYKEKH